MATTTDWKAVDRAKLALADHQSRYGLEGDRATILFHMLADIVELCDSDGIDLDATLGEVRQYFVETGAVQGGYTAEAGPRPAAPTTGSGVMLAESKAA